MSTIGRNRRKRFSGRVKAHYRIGRLGIFIMFFVVFLFAVFVHIEREVSPFMEDYTVVKAKQMMSELFGNTVNRKSEELGLDYENITEITYSERGIVQAVNTDVSAVNKLKNAVTAEISDVLNNEYEYVADIPVGSLFDSEILSGTGWMLKFNNTVTGDVRTDFRSEFETGGINQTVHRLYIDITGEIIVISGGRHEPITFTDSVLLGETVIVGNAVHSGY